jgi:hypothetical protein
MDKVAQFIYEPSPVDGWKAVNHVFVQGMVYSLFGPPAPQSWG